MLLDGKIRPGEVPVLIENYAYTLSWAALAPNTNVQTTKAVDGDSDFLAFYMSSNWFNDGTDAAIPQPKARLQLTDTTSQQPIFSDPTYVNVITGSGGFPYLNQDAKLYPANTIIQATLYNDMIASNVTLDGQVVLGGLRVFYQSATS